MKKLLKFSASWCGSCKDYQPVWDRVVKDLHADWDIQEISLDDESATDIAIQYGVKSLPTTIIVKDKHVKILRGKQTRRQLLSAIGITK